MSLRDKFLVLACVIIMVIGQVLFKQVAINFNKTGVLVSVRVLGLATIAVTLYCLSTALWIVVLRSAELSKAYPFFALGFVLIPLASYFLFKEPLSHWQVLGMLLIAGGITLIGSGK